MSVECVIVSYLEEENLIKSSAILLNKRWLIVPAASIITNLYNTQKFPKELETLETSKIIENNFLNIVSSNVKIIFSEVECITNVTYHGIFSCKNIKNTKKFPIQCGESNDSNNLLSFFIIFGIKDTFDKKGFYNDVSDLLQKCSDLILKRGLHVCIESSPMGSEQFYNSYSKGIVSNIVGNNNCFVLTDAPTAPGCEGGIIYTFKDNNENSTMIPFGIVTASINYWRGEHTGLTLGVTLVPLLSQLLIRKSNLKECFLSNEHSVMDNADKSIVQVFCGNGWGTGILINKELGIFITASHVVNSSKFDQIILKWRNIQFSAHLIFRTENSFAYDLAVLKCDIKYIRNMMSIKFATKLAKKGDVVVSIGYSIFKSEDPIYPVYTKGNISLVDRCILHTTCCILGGSSGGAILNENGELLGIIVCHTTVSFDNGLVVYPKINMAIPISAVYEILIEYIKTNNVIILKKLEADDPYVQKIWKLFQCKL